MNRFFWLASSGALWLLVLKMPQYMDVLHVEPQTISLARSFYLSTFSIFLIGSLRITAQPDSCRRFLVPYRDAAWLLLPLLSALVLSAYSRDYAISLREGFLLASFYLLQLALLAHRFALDRRQLAQYDLLPPVIFLLVCLSPFLTLCAGAILWFASGRHHPFSGQRSSRFGDAVIMQIPSICIAPALLIAFRDSVSQSGTFARGDIEAIGMIVNGIGAAAWTAMVLKGTGNLLRNAFVLGALGVLLAATTGLTSHELPSILIGILAAESARGCLWLSTTDALARLDRWKGFGFNLVFSVFAFCALWTTTRLFTAHTAIFAYATAHLAAPVTVLLLRARSRAQADSTSVP